MNTAQNTIKELIAQMEEVLEDLPDVPAKPDQSSARTVTAKRAAELTGYTVKALDGRRADGSHPKDELWWYDDKGLVVYDIDALVEKMSEKRWQAKSMLESNAVATRSVSGSGTRARKPTKSTPPPAQLRA